MLKLLILVIAIASMTQLGCGEQDAGDDAAFIQEAREAAGMDSSPPGPPPPRYLPTDAYRTEHDPDAFYTPETVTLEGSYLKVDLDALTPDQFNRVMHRVRTERSTCGSWLTIDECLINRPGCWVAVTLLEQIMREETLKG